MSGIVIVSLDCEGKWGVADRPASPLARRLTDERLSWAYREVTDALREFAIPATFAVVEMFGWSREAQWNGPLRDLADDQPYLRAAPEAIGAGEEGWSAPWLIDLIGDRHEIGSHGFSHTPWDQLSKAQARRELELTPPERRRTLVYPRNRVGHADLLAEYGCSGYRAAPEARSRLASLAREFNLTARAEGPRGDPPALPAGYFINWRGGGRKLVPPQVTRLRARAILRDAGCTNRVAHFWTHPENIATNPSTLVNFRNVIREIALACDSGQLEVMTQIAYCQTRWAT